MSLFSMKVSFFWAVIFGAMLSLKAANLTTDGSIGSINVAIAKASSGDVIMLPAGNFTWTSMIALPAGTSLIGAGTNNTIITASIPSGATIQMQPRAGYTNRISGFTLQGAVGSQGINVVGGNCFRVDNIAFINPSATGLQIYGAYGLVDHCSFITSSYFGIEISGGFGDNSYGDYSWFNPPSYGTTNVVCIEDCYFRNSQFFAVVDNYAGSRFTFRHNYVQDGFIEAHGTDTSQRQRGMRQCELYNNTFNYSTYNNNQAIHLRSGSGVIYSNTFINVEHCAEGVECRYTTAFMLPWGAANGFNPWDSNDVANPYAVTTYTGSGQTNSDGNYSQNQYQFHGIANTNEFQWLGFTLWNTNNGTISAIGDSSGTTNPMFTLYFVKNTGSYAPVFYANTGDTIMISKVQTCLDQVGNGSGDLLVGDSPTPVWLNQTKEGVYFWNNTQIAGGTTNSGAFDSLGGYLCIVEGRDFFNNTPRPGYKPLAYPHPLAATKTKTLSPPSSLSVQSQ